ncbi:MAG: hypothetical protein AAFQ15_07950 [Pseudomonadota bacterium]
MKRLLAAIISLCVASGIASPLAAAEGSCPDDAEQTLYNATVLFHNGKISPQEVWNNANTALNICSDRSVTLGLAAQLFAQLYQTIEADAERLVIAQRGLQAVIQSDRAYDNDETVEILKVNETEPTPIYPYGTASMALRDVFIPALTYFSMIDETVPEMSTTLTFETCPYTAGKQDRALKEAEAIIKTAKAFGGNTKIAGPEARILALSKVCSEQSEMLRLRAASLYADKWINERGLLANFAFLPDQTEDQTIAQLRAFSTVALSKIDLYFQETEATDETREFRSNLRSQAKTIADWIERHDAYQACLENRTMFSALSESCEKTFVR